MTTGRTYTLPLPALLVALLCGLFAAGPAGATAHRSSAKERASLPRVVSANGKFVGVFMQRTIGRVFVMRGGGLWDYYWQDGTLVADDPIYYFNAQCVGQAYSGGFTNKAKAERVAKRTLGPWRIAYRTDWDSLGKPMAFKGVDRVDEIVAPFTLYSLDSSGRGTCEKVDDFTETAYYLPIQPVTAPPDFKGPLRLR